MNPGAFKDATARNIAWSGDKKGPRETHAALSHKMKLFLPFDPLRKIVQRKLDTICQNLSVPAGKALRQE
jgi:hypothetical protein